MTGDLIQLHDFKFPSGLDWPLATLTCRVDDLAARLELEVECWEEDGLGPARGFALGPSTSPILISEQVFHVAANPLGATVITLDGDEAATIDHAALLDRALAMLGLERDMVSWVPDDLAGWALGAAQVLAAGKARRAKARLSQD
jgi:hypothetical protein